MCLSTQRLTTLHRGVAIEGHSRRRRLPVQGTCVSKRVNDLHFTLTYTCTCTLTHIYTYTYTYTQVCGLIVRLHSQRVMVRVCVHGWCSDKMIRALIRTYTHTLSNTYTCDFSHYIHTHTCDLSYYIHTHTRDFSASNHRSLSCTRSRSIHVPTRPQHPVLRAHKTRDRYVCVDVYARMYTR
jgi:hypothetical protein